jgi:hypothetical protein
MTKIISNKNGILRLDAISKEEDLNPKCRIIINGPPQDGRCQVCGRHMSELTPFGGPGDPVVGDFTGELLVKIFRWDFPPDVEAEKAWEEAAEAWKEAGNPGDEPDLVIWDERRIGKIPLENKEAYEKSGAEQDKWYLSWFIDRYGEEKGKRMFHYNSMSPCTSKSWECRDCIVLDDDEYFEKLNQRYQEKR